MHFRNLFLSTGLVMTLGLLLIAVIDPLISNGKSLKARVIDSDEDSSTIALPDGSIARVAVGNLKEQSLIKVAAKQRLFSRLPVYKLTQTLSQPQKKAQTGMNESSRYSEI
ncbi:MULTISPECIES: hypothetical protein [unclassified Shewanella]|uniref:hypothetical protein n=1 Tax=unclassified Shewanella TaxID=196818 RepID=UPI001BBA0E41|nr:MULTISPECIES: hypothetical protein [unclassified Shewanella]GIU06522.1 hypothetical protein TUM4444_04490 [Shewanella sp. MBTL60-112-B1]GIU26702.1 hypothetical protein TUM4445_06170 [Shewanella sp. MBTL60-112-B2]